MYAGVRPCISTTTFGERAEKWRIENGSWSREPIVDLFAERWYVPYEHDIAPYATNAGIEQGSDFARWGSGAPKCGDDISAVVRYDNPTFHAIVRRTNPEERTPVCELYPFGRLRGPVRCDGQGVTDGGGMPKSTCSSLEEYNPHMPAPDAVCQLVDHFKKPARILPPAQVEGVAATGDRGDRQSNHRLVYELYGLIEEERLGNRIAGSRPMRARCFQSG